MPYDIKYGQVTLEHQRNIGDDEPVIVFRAQDALLPEVLVFYAQRCREEGSPDRHVEKIGVALEVITAWQENHYTKIPTSDGVQP